ncbi:MAG: hypothetical protein OXT74_09460, partial [Candidatus Poribacteria bacterium]|nr:hypothetical protein [Candidatus Poribacteria bacterium]
MKGRIVSAASLPQNGAREAHNALHLNKIIAEYTSWVNTFVEFFGSSELSVENEIGHRSKI